MPGNFDSQVFPSTFFAQVYNFGPDHTSRIAKYQNCWNFYDGNHWNIAAPEGYDQVTINYAKAFVKKTRRFTFRNGWELTYSEEQKNDKIDLWIKEIWKNNHSTDLTNRVSDFGGIFGDWYIYPQWLPKEDEEETENPKSLQVKLTALDPRYVFPQYNNRTGEMEYCVILIPYEDYELNSKNEFEITNKIYREIHTKEKIYVQEFDDRENVIYENVLPNPLNRMLIVHGIHQPKAGSFYGEGIIEDIIGSQKLFNEKVSNISEILDYHAAPITIIYGAKARQLEKGANKIWSGLPANSKVENLSSEGNIPTSREFVQDAKTWMHELANIPADALGAERDISNTSAVALSIDFEPMIELAEDIRYYFNKGIKEVNEILIDIGIYLGEIKTNLKGPELYNMEIEHGPLLPRDRAADLADIVVEISQGLESKAGAMKRLNVKDIPAKQAEIAAEQEEEKKKEAELAEKYMDPMQKVQMDVMKNPPVSAATKAVNKSPATHGEQVSAAAKKAKS